MAHMINQFAKFHMKSSKISVTFSSTRRCGFLVGIFVLMLTAVPAGVRAETSHLWKNLLMPGHFALIRHAIAPGTGDPAVFDITDCQTQRNLSDEGRMQAQRIGARFLSNGINKARVLTSQWCRCRDTARLFDLGSVEELPLLNSFYNNYEKRETQTDALKAWITKQPLDAPLVLVTHQVNITALTGVYPDSGEAVIVRRSSAGELSVVGSLRTN